MWQVWLSITGRVQMVRFRDFTQKTAQEYGVFGWVKNEPDGSVIVEAQGEEKRLQHFIASLWQGSYLSRVDQIEQDWQQISEFEYIEFRIMR